MFTKWKTVHIKSCSITRENSSCRELLVKTLLWFRICVHIINAVQKLKMNKFTVILFGTCLLVALTAVSAVVS